MKELDTWERVERDGWREFSWRSDEQVGGTERKWERGAKQSGRWRPSDGKTDTKRKPDRRRYEEIERSTTKKNMEIGGCELHENWTGPKRLTANIFPVIWLKIKKRTPLRNFMKVSGLRYPCRCVLKILSSGMWRRVTWPKQKHAATAYPEDGVSSFLRMSVNFYQKIGRHISKHIIIIIIHIKMC